MRSSDFALLEMRSLQRVSGRNEGMEMAGLFTGTKGQCFLDLFSSTIDSSPQSSVSS